MRLIFQTK